MEEALDLSSNRLLDDDDDDDDDDVYVNVSSMLHYVSEFPTPYFYIFKSQ